MANQRGKAPYYGAFEKIEDIATMEAHTKHEYIMKVEAIGAMRAYARTAAEVDGLLPEKALEKQRACHGLIINTAQRFRAAGFSDDYVQQQEDKSMKALGTFGFSANNLADFSVEDVPECAQCGEPETESRKLSHCSRCKQVMYCTRECQRKAWKAGHKNACRDFAVVAEQQRREALGLALSA